MPHGFGCKAHTPHRASSVFRMTDKNAIETTADGASSGLAAWAHTADVLFCDVWGVVHDGLRAMPDAVDALQRFRQRGGTVMLITNAPRPSVAIVAMLDRMGVARDAYDAIVSSGEITSDLIAARGAASVHHLGPPRDNSLFEVAIERGGKPRKVGVEDADYVVCSGLMTDDDTPDMYDDVLQRMLAKRLDLICANPDIVVHTGDKLVWCAGALAERYAALGGPVILVGKPHAHIYEGVRARARAIRRENTPNARVLAIGDGMLTDILGADRQGVASILITSGIHRDRIRVEGPDGRLVVEPAAYAALAKEVGATPTGHMPELVW